MEHRIKNITKIKNNQLTKCETCNLYHLIFNNIFLEFSPIEFENFKQYIMHIEIDFWEGKNSHINLIRKIPIPTMQENLVIMFDKCEIEELKSLIFCKNTNEYELLKANAIDYSSLLN